MSNPIVAVLKRYGAPQTRKELLDVAYLGKPPANLDPESEAELPDEPRYKRFPETTHEEVAAEEAEKEKSKK